MFRPKCKAEYREGFHRCSDCDVTLVDEAPVEQEPEFVDYEEVLATYNAADIAVIKSLLDSENITYFVKGEQFTYNSPLTDPARLMVRKDQAEEAKKILKDLKLSFLGPNLKKESKKNKGR